MLFSHTVMCGKIKFESSLYVKARICSDGVMDERIGERQVELTFQLGTLCEGGKAPGPRGKHDSKSTSGVGPG